jgi:hypothetical protein
MRSGYEPQAWIYLDRSRGDATFTRIVNRMWEHSYTHACLAPMRKQTSTRDARPTPGETAVYEFRIGNFDGTPLSDHVNCDVAPIGNHYR